MQNPNSARLALTRKLFNDSSLSTGEEVPLPEVPAAIRTISIRDGNEVMASLVEPMIREELAVLLWPPVLGAQIILSVLDSAPTSRSLFEASCRYLSCFYPILDDVIARGYREFTKQPTPTTLHLVQRRLATQLRLALHSYESYAPTNTTTESK